MPIALTEGPQTLRPSSCTWVPSLLATLAQPVRSWRGPRGACRFGAPRVPPLPFPWECWAHRGRGSGGSTLPAPWCPSGPCPEQQLVGGHTLVCGSVPPLSAPPPPHVCPAALTALCCTRWASPGLRPMPIPPLQFEQNRLSPRCVALPPWREGGCPRPVGPAGPGDAGPLCP